MPAVLIAPDSFKGTLEAHEVCEIIGRAFKEVIKDCDITELPVADGGEGLCACLRRAAGGEMKKCEVSGVFGEKMIAEYLMLPDMTAVIETASCAGLPLAGENKDPMRATTLGVGEQIAHAAACGAERILLGLGGSATNDCGAGMASALGWIFKDKNGREFVPAGGTLTDICDILPPENRLDIPVTAACDVDNPLYGERGAAYVFAPQKGADAEAVKILDGGLKNISNLIKAKLGIDVSLIPGAGAAGGMGAGTIAFLGGDLKRGIDIILDITEFDKKASECDLIITGEGRLDSQSVDGKVISGVAKRAAALGKKVITICGCAGDGYEKAREIGVSDMFFSCEKPKPHDELLKTCRDDLCNAAKKAALEIYETN